MGGCGRLELCLMKGVDWPWRLRCFFGEFEHALDAKGRLIIPAKFRELLGTSFVITRGMDGCIFGYPAERWATLQAQLDDLPLTRKDARAFVRFFYAAAAECELDKQGRVMIPATLTICKVGKAMCDRRSF
ncbi:Transcriptional regulator MraZ [Lactiplantibacillus plantarum]|nr:Transcriptional regulator MraZ [Lactiplantibacillus plantarum]